MQTPTTTIGRALVFIRDLRKARRYQLNEVVAFSWEHGDGSTSRMTGITQDISTIGICFVAAPGIDVGTRIRLDLFLTSASRASQAIRLHAVGFVCRVECSGTGQKEHRIAAEIAFQEDPDESVLASTEIQ